ncbi:hypothetical protein EON64_15485, partial [archaeon]
CNIIHRDLKPENVMVTRGMLDIKLIDFGMARFMPSASADSIAMTAAVGTQFYMSYAKMHGKKFTLTYDGRDDVWAVGCIILELLLGVSMTRQLALCEDDNIRTRLLQAAKQRHAGMGRLLERVLGKKENDAIPHATLLLMLVDGANLLMDSGAMSELAEGMGKISANPSETAGNRFEASQAYPLLPSITAVYIDNVRWLHTIDYTNISFMYNLNMHTPLCRCPLSLLDLTKFPVATLCLVC